VRRAVPQLALLVVDKSGERPVSAHLPEDLLVPWQQILSRKLKATALQ
jgi:hypothetical protein